LRYFTALLFCISLALPVQAEILIGVAGPLSGQNAVYGNELRNGAAAAIAATNAQGGINGELLALVEGDDACDAKRAVDVANSFVGKDVRMVVGHFCTSASLAAAPAYLNAGILMLNASVTAPDLTSKSLWNVFRLTGRDDAQGEVAAARIKADGQGADVFLITDDQAETAAIVKRFRSALPNAKVVTVKAGDVKLPDDAGLIVATSIYLAMQPIDAAEVAKNLRKLNTTAQLYGPDLLQSESFGTRGVGAVEGSLVTFLNDNLQNAATKTVTALPNSDGATLAAYAAVETFAAAAKARSVNDGRGMASWLAAGNEVATSIGPLRFNASGDLQQQPYVWYQWKDGALVPETPRN
jgi:branched-chain amino acid transport system substrate-binding protein